jgi:hypothetical protein
MPFRARDGTPKGGRGAAFYGADGLRGQFSAAAMEPPRLDLGPHRRPIADTELTRAGGSAWQQVSQADPQLPKLRWVLVTTLGAN